MNQDRLVEVIASALALELRVVRDDLQYNSIPQWDSVGHMALVAELESAFDVMLDINDIIAMSSVAKIREILGKYGVGSRAAA